MESPIEGQFLVGISYLSVDPYMRGRMNATRSYADPQKLDEVMGGGAVGKVFASRHPGFAEGEYVVGMFGWQQYALSDSAGVMKVDPHLAPISTSLGVLGMPGLTAYFGLLDVCAPRAGETVVVSGAAGAVGSAAGQTAKIHGCRVVGIAGGADKINGGGLDLCASRQPRAAGGGTWPPDSPESSFTARTSWASSLMLCTGDLG